MPQAPHLSHRHTQIDGDQTLPESSSPLTSAFHKMKRLIPAYDARNTVTGTVIPGLIDKFQML